MTDSQRQPGYRGALPPRNDRLAGVWVAMVAAIVVLIFVLAVLGLPSRLFPEPTPLPLPSIPAPSVPLEEGSPEASPSG